MDLLPIKRAIISVTDKSGLVDFAAFLNAHGVEIISTGGTKKILEEAHIPVTAVSSVTGFPEILGGRVKTLHPKIHAGILANKDNSEHMGTLNQLGIRPFDMVCVNLYDFSSAVEKHLNLTQAVEEIDIGGPCLLRAAAKNFNSILPLPSPTLYEKTKEELINNDMKVPLAFRQQLAADTFAMVSRYDAMISSYLAS